MFHVDSNPNERYKLNYTLIAHVHAMMRLTDNNERKNTNVNVIHHRFCDVNIDEIYMLNQ